MKQLTLKASLFITIFLQATTYAQEKKLTGLVYGGVEYAWGYMAGYEHNLNGNSISIGWSGWSLDINNDSLSTNSFTAGYTLYSQSAFRGWFTAPNLAYRDITLKNGSNELVVTIWEPHLNSGYAFLISNRVQLRFHVGLGYGIFGLTLKAGNKTVFDERWLENSFLYRFGITLGIAF